MNETVGNKLARIRSSTRYAVYRFRSHTKHQFHCLTRLIDNPSIRIVLASDMFWICSPEKYIFDNLFSISYNLVTFYN